MPGLPGHVCWHPATAIGTNACALHTTLLRGTTAPDPFALKAQCPMKCGMRVASVTDIGDGPARSELVPSRCALRQVGSMPLWLELGRLAPGWCAPRTPAGRRQNRAERVVSAQ